MTDMMFASVLYPSGEFVTERVPVPQPGDNEVLMRIRACGVCMSEVSWWKLGSSGRFFPDDDPRVLDWVLGDIQGQGEHRPVVLGHEPAGEIVAVGKNVSDLRPGMKAVALGSAGFAEYAVYSASHVYPIDDATPYHLALGEPLACVFNANKRTQVGVGDNVVLIGCGFMGLLHLQMMKLAKPGMLIAIDIRDDALALAKQLGADRTINSAQTNPLEAVRDIIGPNGADVVVEAVGKQASLDLAGKLVAFRGRIIVIGFHQGQPRTLDMAMLNWKGVDIINAHERAKSTYFTGMVGGIGKLEAGQITMEPLVTHSFGLDEVGDAFKTALAKPDGFVKAVIQPG